MKHLSQRRVEVVGKRNLHHLIIILVVEPPWVAREADRHHRIHIAGAKTQMVVEGEMYACVGRGREGVPTVGGHLEITVSIFGGTQAHVGADAQLQSDEIGPEEAQIAAQHQGNLGIMQAVAVGVVTVLVHLLVGRMGAKERILQFHLCREIVVDGQIGIGARSEAQLVEARIVVAIHLAERRANNESGIEALGKDP